MTDLNHAKVAQNSPMRAGKDSGTVVDKPPEPGERKAAGSPDTKGSKDLQLEFCEMPEKHCIEPPLTQLDNITDSFDEDANWAAQDDLFLDDAECQGVMLEEAESTSLPW